MGTQDIQTDPVGVLASCMTDADIQDLYQSVLAKAKAGNSAAITFLTNAIKLIDARDVSHEGDGVIRPPEGLDWDADGMLFTDGDGVDAEDA